MKTLSISVLFVLAQTLLCLGVGQELKDAPDGVAIKLKEDGGYQITSVGTGTYDFNDPDDVLDARRSAEMQAKAAIVKFLNEELSAADSFDEVSRKTKLLNSDGTTSTKQVSKESVKVMTTSIRNSASSLLKGVVVLQDAKMPCGEGGTCRVMVGVSSKTTEVARMADKDIKTDSTDSNDANGAIAIGISVSKSLTPPDGWIVCVGCGVDRKTAVHEALVEGVAQVYGAALKNESKLNSRMKRFKKNATILGKAFSIKGTDASLDSESTTLSKTAGFVKEFRIVQVVDKDGLKEATVYAHLYKDKAPVCAPTVFVDKPRISLDEATTRYQLGPKRLLSGAEIASEIEKTLPCGLAEANRFVVVPEGSAVDGIEVDYRLDTEISDIQYSSSLGMDKRTHEFGTQYKMSVRVRVKLLNAESGQLIKSDDLTLSLSNEEIAAMLDNDKNADLLQAVLRKLARPIKQWIS